MQWRVKSNSQDAQVWRVSDNILHQVGIRTSASNRRAFDSQNMDAARLHIQEYNRARFECVFSILLYGKPVSKSSHSVPRGGQVVQELRILPDSGCSTPTVQLSKYIFCAFIRTALVPIQRGKARFPIK